jgi:glycosyltransferase involved in cell wall biosynthesis
LSRLDSTPRLDRPLRVALTVDPEISVPPVHYGGIERLVDMLAVGLEARGCMVTVFAHPESRTAGKLIAWPGRSSRSVFDTAQNAAVLARHVLSGCFDLVHSFSRIAYMLPFLPLRIPKLMTYQRKITRRSVRLGHTLSRGTLWFSAVSRKLMQHVSHVGTWRLAFNGVPLARYDFCKDPGPCAPLVFLGRVEEIKGPHLALEVSRRAGIPLIIAGNVPAEHRAWFEANIAPHVDGHQVIYTGPVDDKAKNALLGRARGLLMPILWEEPFGIVMAEAMACGTPVIGLSRGAVPEIVEHGVTGFVAGDIEGLVEAVEQIGQIDRATCRARVERLFSDVAITESYLTIYAEMLGACNRRETSWGRSSFA